MERVESDKGCVRAFGLSCETAVDLEVLVSLVTSEALLFEELLGVDALEERRAVAHDAVAVDALRSLRLFFEQLREVGDDDSRDDFPFVGVVRVYDLLNELMQH